MSPTPSKDKGDRAERALVTYLQAWWPNVRRTKAGGEKDLGDLSGLIDRDGDEWCVQVADRKSLVNPWAVEAKAAEARQQADRDGRPDGRMHETTGGSVMGRKAQIAALEQDNTRLVIERDKALRELAHLRVTSRKPKPEPSLTDVARREFHDRWGWLLDLAGFGK